MKRIVIILLSLVAVFALIILGGCCMFSGTVHNGPKTDHFDGERFFNIDKSPERGFWDMIKWSMNRDKGFWRDYTFNEYCPAPAKRIEGDSLVVTFINHSTVLIQTNSLNILTDPVYSDRISPFSFMGPKRHRNPGIKFEDLPEIDLVLVSHNHYDHLDLETLKKLDKKFSPQFITTLGNKELLNKNGIKNVTELDWWQDTVIKSTKVNLVPARHFAMRGLCDRNKSLWGGYVIETRKGPIYFSGDTGFGEHFQKIRDRFGEFRFAMIPIGAYRPRWFMEQFHTNPEDAVKAHLVLGSRKSMGIHFGTFAQADDGEFEPIKDLIKVLKEKSIDPKTFYVPKHGIGVGIE